MWWGLGGWLGLARKGGSSCPSPPTPRPWAVDSQRGICSLLSHSRLPAPAPLSPSTPAASVFMVNGVYSAVRPSWILSQLPSSDQASGGAYRCMRIPIVTKSLQGPHNGG